VPVPLINNELFTNNHEDDEDNFDIINNENEQCVNRVGKNVTTSDKDYELMNTIQRAHKHGTGLPYRNSVIDEISRVTPTLTEVDFMIDETYHFRDSCYEVKFYCPGVFQQIRSCLEVDEAEYYHALNGIKGSFTKIGTPGKSGAFFFFAPTTQYILKSVTEEELDTLLDLLPNYHKHIEDRRKQTLLSTFYSLFTVHSTSPNLKSLNTTFRFVAMNNVFFTNRVIHKRFDLKGSTAGRQASEKELKKHNPILKDNDVNEGEIKLSPALKRKFFERIVADVRFLKENDIIDYSLLLGVHVTSPQDRQHLKAEQNDNFFGAYYHTCYAHDYSEIYYMGIIDILQRYNSRKQLEKTLKEGVSVLKSKLSKKTKESASVQKPFKYSRRFEQFMKILCSAVKLDDYVLGSRKSYHIENSDLIEEFYHKHVWHHGKDAKVYYYRGLMYFALLKWNEMSLFDFSKSISINSSHTNIMSHLMRALTYERCKEYELALNEYSTLIRLNSHCDDAYLLRGVLMHESFRNYDQAERDYNKYLELNPNESDYNQFKKTLKKLGMDPIDVLVQKALLARDRDIVNGNRILQQELDRLIEQHPNRSYYIYFVRALLLEKLDVQKSIQDYSMALELNPRHAASYFNRAQLQRTIDVNWAESDYTNAIKYSKDHLEAYYNRAILFKNRNQSEDALRDLEKCIEIYEYARFANVPSTNRHEILHRELQLQLPPLPTVPYDFSHAILNHKSPKCDHKSDWPHF
jgi:tetratricopeptide (TPR) repeat protein